MAAIGTPRIYIFHIIRIPKWHAINTATAKDALRRRRASHLLPLSRNPRRHHRSLPIRDCNFLPDPSLRPLRRSSVPNMSSLASSAPGDSSPSTKTVRVVIKGRVQGVFYRNWTIENALELGLKGWVRNRRDGSVEALFSGSPEKVQEMEQRCRRGPPAATVTGLQVFHSDEDSGSGFERRPTV